MFPSQTNVPPHVHDVMQISAPPPRRKRITSCPEQRVCEEKRLLAGGSCTGLERLEEYGK